MRVPVAVAGGFPPTLARHALDLEGLCSVDDGAESGLRAALVSSGGIAELGGGSAKSKSCDRVADVSPDGLSSGAERSSPLQTARLIWHLSSCRGSRDYGGTSRETGRTGTL